MFEISRELKRFFQPSPPRDGLSQGDASLLELLDARLLASEAKAADVAAGRIGAKDPARRLIEASGVWRELGRRTGDIVALRKAASQAERAAELAERDGRGPVVAEAICAQVEAALVGADLFGDDGLSTAAAYLLDRAPERPAVQALRAVVAARQALPKAEAAEARALVRAFDEVVAPSGPSRRRLGALMRVQLRLRRAEFMASCGVRLKDAALVQEALADMTRTAEGLDGAYAPLLLARVEEARGGALLILADLNGDLTSALDGLDALDRALELATPDHSPLDWARLQHARGQALTAVGEGADSESAFAKALKAFGQALLVLDKIPNLALRTIAAQDRAACLVRRAEAKGDLFALDEAEAVLRGELAALPASPDPLAWAVLQLNLARIYLAQMAVRGGGRGEPARAGEALLGALEVFAEKGLRSLAAAAESGLEKLREASAAA